MTPPHPSRYSLRHLPQLNQIPIAALICATVLLLGVALAWAQTPDRDRDSQLNTSIEAEARQAIDADPLGKKSDGGRVREGTEIIDRDGFFRLTGDRVTFFSDDGEGRFVGLENLNLERIARTIADNPDKLQWSVTGTVTEYRGANFIFVRRVILKSRLQTEDDIF